MKFLLLLIAVEAYGIGCDPSPGGNCTQPDGTDTCKIENESHCYVSSGASCSRVNNNSGLGLFMGDKASTKDLELFMRNIPRGVTVSSGGCTAGNKNWNVGPATCSANLRALAHGETLEIEDTETAITPGRGLATFSCTGATLTGPTGMSCDSLPPPRCPAATLEWFDGTRRCTFPVVESAVGTPIAAIDNPPGTSGTANFTCTAAGWSAPASPVCDAAPAVGCSLPLPHSWTVTNSSGNLRECTLSGTGTEEFAEGEEKTLGGGQPVAWGSFPLRGSIRYKCVGGSLELQSKSCIADCTIRCQGPLRHRWTGAGNPRPECFCNGNEFETIEHGTSRNFDGEGSGSPANGEMRVSCDDGEFTYDLECRAGAPD